MDHDAARHQMVEQQLIRRHIRNSRVLDAMRTVPRHQFIPEDNRDLAYRDGPVGIGRGQTISQPYLVAYMSEMLGLGPGTRVLEIGTGSGYQSAILCHLGAEVHSIEIIPELAQRADMTLRTLGYGAVQLNVADGCYGLPDQAPFDRIIVTAAPAKIPTALSSQLANGGSMLVPTGDRQAQTLWRITRRKDEWVRERLSQVLFVPMTGDVNG